MNAILLMLLLFAQPSRIYHSVTISDMAAGKVMHTHVEVTGFVTFYKVEDDGDLHIRLCNRADVKGMDRRKCIVAEAIPGLPRDKQSAVDWRFKPGQFVIVRGITRYDKKHSWQEVHPIEDLVIIPPVVE